MDTTAADDKIQAVVRLVLQAVDQRLETVREQLLQVTHTIASNHADLSRRIDECHQVVAAVQSGARSSDSQATVQTSVDHLADQVAVLQERLDEYTASSASDVAAAIAAPPAPVPTVAVPPVAVPPVAVPPVAVPPVSVPPIVAAPVVATPVLAAPDVAAPAAAAAPAVTTAASTTLRPMTRISTAPPRVRTASPTVRPSSRAATASPASPANPSPKPAEPQVDLTSLNEQISARLAAAVDRALGELSAGVPSNSA